MRGFGGLMGPPRRRRPTEIRRVSRRSIAGTVAVGLVAGVLTFVGSGAPALAASADTIGVPIATDTFGRTVASGWGSADLGGAYTDAAGAAGAQGLSVGSATANTTLQPGKSAVVVLRSASAADVSLRTTFTAPTVTGGALYHGLTARVQADGSAYRGRVVIRPDRSASVSVSKYAGGQESYLGEKALGSIAAGATVDLSVTVTGTSPRIVAAVAAAGGVQGQVDVTDGSAGIGSGAVGLWSYLSSSATAVTIKTSSFSAVRVVKAPALTQPAGTTVVRDDFNRAVSAGWGTGPTGGAWTISNPAAASVDGPTGARTTVAANKSVRATVSGSARDVQVQEVFALAALPTGSDRIYHAVTARSQSDGSSYRGRFIVDATGQVRLGVSRTAGSVESYLGESAAGFTIAAGQPSTLELAVTGTNPVTITVTARADGTATTGRFSAPDASAARIQTAGSTGIWTYVDSAPGTPALILTRAFAATDITASSATPTPTTTATTATATTSPRPTTTTTSTSTTTTSTTTAPTTAPTGGGAGRPTSTAGSAQPGSTSYPVPADAVVVAPTGSDSAAGTVAAPLKSVQTAINRAKSGQTIVLRGGTYHESVLMPQDKVLTIQAYPSEAVWFDGSTRVSTWAAQGSIWVADNWTATFDASPTFTRGAADSTAPGWQFVNPAYPMAANPDQVWIDGVPQQQVATAAQVRPGTFAVDYSAKRLYLGSNPTGRQVQASDLATAIKVVSAGSVLRGFGVRNYAPSVPDFGAVSVWRPKVTLENLIVADSATIGLSVDAEGVTVRKVSVLNNGLIGLHANYADNLTVDGLLARGNNDENFNQVPAAAGVKITRSRNIVFRNGLSTANNATGLWFDESVYNIQVLNSDLVANQRHGLVVELSAKVLVAGNLVKGNSVDGILIVNSSDSRIWNNTVTGQRRNINLTQDARRAANAGDAGHDPRQPFPDPTMTWTINPAVISNNLVLGGNATSDALVGVQDFTKQQSAEQMGVTMNRNYYYRVADSSPGWLAVWSKGGGANPSVAASLTAFQALGQERSARYSTDASVLDSSGLGLTAAAMSQAVAIAQPIPADVLTALGWSTGTRRLGAIG